MAHRDSFSRIRREDGRWQRGDIKYLILDLLKERPSYGYEIMRALEERFGGLYSPSAGAIYPTLQMLEEMGLVSSELKEGRKVFALTPAGSNFLLDQREQAEVVRDRMRGWWDRRSTSEDMHAVIDAVDEIKKVLRRQRRHIDPAKVKQLREAMARTVRDVESILKV